MFFPQWLQNRVSSNHIFAVSATGGARICCPARGRNAPTDATAVSGAARGCEASSSPFSPATSPISYISLAATFYKSHRALISLRLLFRKMSRSAQNALAVAANFLRDMIVQIHSSKLPKPLYRIPFTNGEALKILWFKALRSFSL